MAAGKAPPHAGQGTAHKAPISSVQLHGSGVGTAKQSSFEEKRRPGREGERWVGAASTARRQEVGMFSGHNVSWIRAAISVSMIAQPQRSHESVFSE